MRALMRPMEIDMIKVRKNSKIKVWNIYAFDGENLGTYSFHTQEVKAYFPGCTIKGNNVYLP
jgi:hypothetical protein